VRGLFSEGALRTLLLAMSLLALGLPTACSSPAPPPSPGDNAEKAPKAGKAAKAGKARPPRPAADGDIARVVKPAVEDPKAWGDARCNDGSAFGYLLRKTESKTWVIAFEGGFFCDDEVVSCAGRKQKLTSALPGDDGAMTSLANEGAFSRDATVNPLFHDANLVGAQYCSSDLWTGESNERRQTNGDPDGWYFSGRINARVLLASLAKEGLDDADPETKILVVGSSAGGAGVVANLDQLLAAFPKTGRSGRMKVILDGSWVPPQPTDARLPDGAKWGKLQPECDADLRKKGENPSHCVFGTVWWPYVAKTGVPVLIQIAGLDATQLPVFDVRGPADQEKWKEDLLKSLDGVPWVFTGGRRYHTLSLDPGWALGAENKTFRDLVGRFWRGDPPERWILSYEGVAPGGDTPEKQPPSMESVPAVPPATGN
jgi:hypothetical protein